MAEYTEDWAKAVRERCMDMTDADLDRLWRCEKRLAELEAARPEVDYYIKMTGKDKNLWNTMLRIADDDVYWASRRYSSDRNTRRYDV